MDPAPFNCTCRSYGLRHAFSCESRVRCCGQDARRITRQGARERSVRGERSLGFTNCVPRAAAPRYTLRGQRRQVHSVGDKVDALRADLSVMKDLPTAHIGSAMAAKRIPLSDVSGLELLTAGGAVTCEGRSAQVFKAQ